MIARPALAAVTEALDGVTDPREAVDVDFVRAMLDTAPRMGFAHRDPTASGTFAPRAQPHTAATSLAQSHPSPRGSLLHCRGALPTMRPTLSTDALARAMGCSLPTARRIAAEWAGYTRAYGCTDAGDACRCRSAAERWPHTATVATGKPGRPGYAIDAEQLAAHLDAVRALAALDAELAREAA